MVVSVADHPVPFWVNGTGVYDVTDGRADRPASLLLGVDQAMLERYLPAGTFATAFHYFLISGPEVGRREEIKDGEAGRSVPPGRRVLVDTGFGKGLPDELAALGLGSGDIDAVLLTHMHPDHVGGLLRDGRPALTRAEVYVSAPELAWWTDETVMRSQPEDRREGFRLARAIADAYGERLRAFEPGDLDTGGAELLPGEPAIRAVAAYGHTPGHTMYLMEGRDGQFLFWGDTIHAAAVQFARPEVAVTYDVDPVRAVAARKRALAWADGREGRWIAGAHLPDAAIGTVHALSSGGYEYRPSPGAPVPTAGD